MPRVSYTPAQMTEALWMLDNGWSALQAADRVGCTDATIYAWRDRRAAGKLDLPENFRPPVDLELTLERRQKAAAPAEPEQQSLAPASNDAADTGSAWDEAFDEPAKPEPSSLVVPVPVQNGGEVERADVQVLDLAKLVAELDSWRQQLVESQQQTARANAELAAANAALATAEATISQLRSEIREADEVARDALLAERAKTTHYRTVMRFEMEERDAR